MATKQSIQAFVTEKQLAVAGVSRNKNKFGYQVYDELKKRGYMVHPINPNTDNIKGDKCYKNLSELPANIKNLFIVTPSSKTSEILNQAIKGGIKNIWVQQRSEFDGINEISENNNINIITNECILMFAEPVTGIHKFHRFLKKVFGGLPE